MKKGKLAQNGLNYYPVTIDSAVYVQNKSTTLDNVCSDFEGRIQNTEELLFNDTVEDTFIRRKTAGKTINGNIATIKTIQGNAVAWNQLVDTFSNAYDKPYGQEIVYSGNGFSASSLGEYSAFRWNCSGHSGHKLFYDVTFYTDTNDGGIFIQPQGNNIEVYSRGRTSGISEFGSSNENITIFIYPSMTNVSIRDFYLIDLTLLFGVGNEPSTAEDFEAWLANNIGTRAYYPYNAGELIPCNLLGIKTVGFNQWDEEWENGAMDTYAPGCTGGKVADGCGYLRCKNYIPIFPNTAYYLKGSDAFNVGFYDANQNYLGYFEGQYETNSITSPSGAYYMSIQSTNPYNFPYNHDICINISNSSKNGTYEPYKTFTRNLDVTKLYGKNSQGNYVQMFPNGMRSAGSVHDVVDLENATADVKVGTRAYLSGDESDSTVITDMTNTFYPLATPIHYTDVVYRDGGIDIPTTNLQIKVDNFGTEEIIFSILNNTPLSIAPTITINYGIDAINRLNDLNENYVTPNIILNFSEGQKQRIRENIGVIKIVVITQADYNDLAIKDSNTLYIIN